MDRWVLIFFLLNMIIFSGCVHTTEFTREEVKDEPDHNITLHLTDGRLIKFDKGEYKISGPENDSISGRGILIFSDAPWGTKKFEGTIALDEIQSYSDSEMTTFGRLAVITLGVSAGLVVATYLLFAYSYAHMH